MSSLWNGDEVAICFADGYRIHDLRAHPDGAVTVNAPDKPRNC
ncbi:hypothetical protein [Nonomuraea fuscirosea]|nr:hypothetical protein [Nonomuraea fuscirosea]